MQQVKVCEDESILGCTDVLPFWNPIPFTKTKIEEFANIIVFVHVFRGYGWVVIGWIDIPKVPDYRESKSWNILIIGSSWHLDRMGESVLYITIQCSG